MLWELDHHRQRDFRIIMGKGPFVFTTPSFYLSLGFSPHDPNVVWDICDCAASFLLAGRRAAEGWGTAQTGQVVFKEWEWVNLWFLYFGGDIWGIFSISPPARHFYGLHFGTLSLPWRRSHVRSPWEKRSSGTTLEFILVQSQPHFQSER